MFYRIHTVRVVILAACASQIFAGCMMSGNDDPQSETDNAIDSVANSNDENEEAIGVATEALTTCPYTSYLCGHDGLNGSSTLLYYCSGAGAIPKLSEQCVGTCTIVSGANDKCPVVDGWSSQTGYRKPVDQALINIAAGVTAGASLPSITGSPWIPDTGGGDGQRMRNALIDLHNWYLAQNPKPALPLASIPSSLRTTMLGRLTATYTSANATSIVDRAVALYKGVSPPTTDDGTLAYFGMLAQCKEFADRKVAAGGGVKKSYSTSSVATRDVRQGNYAFLYSNGSPAHAAIVLDVYWQGGSPTQLKLGESNWGSGWSNPTGQVPWSRTVSTTRTVPYSSYYVVSSL